MTTNTNEATAERPPLRILSLGAGVQSSCLLLMSCRGELPKLDVAIFADTQAEPPAVYDHLEWLKAQCAAAGIPYHQVTAGNLRADAISFRANRASEDGKRYASIPLFVLNPDGSKGRIRRQCTSEYKIEPIERFVRRELLGIPAGRRAPKTPVVEQWLGITLDESSRAKVPSNKQRDGKPSPIYWKTHAFPLMGVVKWWGMSDGGLFGQPQPIPLQGPWTYRERALEWTRAECVAWLAANYPDRRVPRSACVECPHRSNAEWREMKEHDPASFAVACASDDAYRAAELGYQVRPETVAKFEGRLVGIPYVHRSCRPLREVDFDAPAESFPVSEVDESGETLFARAAETECEGYCGN